MTKTLTLEQIKKIFDKRYIDFQCDYNPDLDQAIGTPIGWSCSFYNKICKEPLGCGIFECKECLLKEFEKVAEE